MPIERPALATIGPYAAVEKLGAGGMGIVYRAVHRVTGRVVALKTLRSLQELPLAAIRREIRALAAVKHPNVVPILDEGVEGGVPWYAMELVDGTSLRGVLDEVMARITTRQVPGEESLLGSSETTLTLAGIEPAPGQPITRPMTPWSEAGIGETRRVGLPIAVCLALASRICEPLAYMHGEGFVHRDLKPDNVMLRPDGSIVLLDFNLVARFASAEGREVLDTEPLWAGTPAYMSPEQTAGSPVDARADLYSLGCLLFELITGSPPFIGSPSAILTQHRLTRPLAPSMLVPGVPADVDALVLHLLEKDPAKRMGHATDVITAVRRSSVADAADQALGPPSATPKPPPKLYLYRPGFVGRDAIAADLARWAATSGMAKHKLTLIGGSAGAGKTRLMLEVARRVHATSVRSYAGTCRPLATSPSARLRAGALHPFAGFLLGVADRARAAGPAGAALYFGPACRVLAEVVPDLATLPSADQWPEPEPVSPEAARDRLLGALLSVLRAVAVEREILIVLDDLQWMDELTARFLRGTVEGPYAVPGVTILAAYRSEEAGDDVLALASLRGVESVLIDRLDDREVGAIAGAMLAIDPCPPALASRIAALAGGNPFFVAEALRAALGGGLLDRTTDGVWTLAGVPIDRADAPIPLPDKLRTILEDRIARLDADARALASAAAVLGIGGDDHAVEKIAALPSERFARALAALRREHVFEEGRLRIAHDALRAAILDALDPPARARHHRRAAEILGGAAGPSLLADHWEHAGEPLLAIEHLERAADLALRRGAYNDAAASLRRAIAIDGGARVTVVRRASWDRKLAQASLALGRLDDANRHAEAALDALDAPAPRSDRAWGIALAGGLARQIGHLAAPSLLHALRTDPAERARLIERAEASGTLARAAFFESHKLKMLGASVTSVNLAERAGHFAVAARNYGGVGFMCGLVGLHGFAERYFAKARDAGASNADFPGLVFALTSEAVYLLGQGKFERARAALAIAAESATKTGDPQDTELVETLLGHADCYEGDPAASRARYASVLASARARQNAQNQAWALYCSARGAIAMGLFGEAIAELDEAIALAASARDPMSEAVAYGLAAKAMLLAGDRAGASIKASAARRVLASTEPTVFLIAHAYEGIAEVAIDRAARAVGIVERARAAAEARRACGDVAKLGRSFPVTVPIAERLTARLFDAIGVDALRARAEERARDAAKRLGMKVF